MLMWVARIFIIIIGPIIGYFQIAQNSKGILIGTGVAVGVIFIEWLIEKIPLDDVIAAILGIIIGLIFVKVLDYLIVVTFNEKVVEVWYKYSLLVKITVAYIAMLIAVKKKGELYLLDQNITLTSRKIIPESILVDTSVLVDGRIVEIAKSNFILSVLVVPRFIINEIQMLADSSDDLKRTKGRRALDVIAELEKKESGVRLKIFEKDYSDIETTDEKLLKCASEIKARIMTNDYNLSKVAQIRGIKVLNINSLAKALKPIVLPGETLDVYLLKEGKENRQAVGYLDDGTMVVVENARRFIGQKKRVVVTSSIQTDAGRMIFAHLDHHHEHR
ncbi:MAG: TRAM domain-containing protein [Elusimicrobia bacterium]|nr:TRAM domain-containing protein [Elusimicrobiota bacterium]